MLISDCLINFQHNHAEFKTVCSMCCPCMSLLVLVVAVSQQAKPDCTTTLCVKTGNKNKVLKSVHAKEGSMNDHYASTEHLYGESREADEKIHSCTKLLAMNNKMFVYPRMYAVWL